MDAHPSNRRLLIFGCHEAWVYQLHALDQPIDIVVDLPGRPTGWDTAMRPIPKNARCVRMTDVLSAQESYNCIVAHNLPDLSTQKLSMLRGFSSFTARLAE